VLAAGGAGVDAGAEAGGDFAAQAPAINTAASVANTNGFMFWTPSLEI
jgi:hypothetical protein